MNKENLQIVFGVAVLLLLSFVGPDANISTEPETATVVDSIDDEGITETNGPTGELQANKFAEVEDSETIDLGDSFDESALKEESENVQEGIDLLDSPLQ